MERQVLGALMLRSDLVVPVTSVLQKSDFYLESHRHLFDAIASLSLSGNTPDPLQVIQYLKDRDLLQSVLPPEEILSLVENVISAGNAPQLSRRLKNLAVRRELILTVQDISTEAYRPHEDENQFLKSVADKVLKITNQTAADGPVLVRDVKNDFVDYIEQLYKAKGGLSGLATGFLEFDNLTSGLKGGELIVLAARPGMGKTTLAMNMAANIAIKQQKHVLLYSLEMGRLELLLRMLCAEAQMNLADMKKGLVPREKVQQILSTIDKVTSAPLSLEDSGTVDIWDIITLTRKLAVDLDTKGESLGLVIIDYLQLVADPEARSQGRQNEVASVSRSLKQLARMVDVPVIAVSQMNRSVEQRKGDSARPQLSDLRESGAIEQDADMVMFIHREQLKDEDALSPEQLENRGTAEIIIAKHRNGPVGSFRLAYRPEINRFDNRPGALHEDIV